MLIWPSYALYTVHCTLYTVHCTLYTVHCTTLMSQFGQHPEPLVDPDVCGFSESSFLNMFLVAGGTNTVVQHAFLVVEKWVKVFVSACHMGGV